MKPSDAIISLDAYIEAEVNSLKRYAEKPDANPEYIQRKNQDIANLCDIYNSVASLKYIDRWFELEAGIYKLEARDPQLNGHCIIIHKKDTGDNFSYTEINFY